MLQLYNPVLNYRLHNTQYTNIGVGHAMSHARVQVTYVTYTTCQAYACYECLLGNLIFHEL